MEHIHHVVGHPLLSYDHFLTSIDDKVATLIVSAIFTIFHSLMFIQVLELAEITSEHDWDLTNVDASIVLLEDHSLDLAFPLASLRTVVEVILKFFFAKLNICVKLCSIGQVAHSSLMGKHWHHAVV